MSVESSVYPAARAAAARLREYFSGEAAAAAEPGTDASVPDVAAIESMVDAAFWASLQREEGYAPEISLAFLPPGQALQPMLLATPLPLGSHELARLAPAVERPGIHLGVYRLQGELRVWGTTRTVPTSCFVLEVIGPGLLVVKHRVREDSAKFQNVAVFEGERVKILRGQAARLPQRRCRLRSLVLPGSTEEPAEGDSIDVPLRLAISMRAHRRGGALLLVPAGTRAWQSSVVRPIAYAVDPPFRELAELAERAARAHEPGAYAALDRAVDAVAGLTAVDGATLMTDAFELLAFGVKITRADGRPRVEQVFVTEPIEGGAASVMPPLQLGGTRHISAAQFAHDQQDAVALVASQDGRFTSFAWCIREGMVRAHRVESLLL